MYGLTGVVALVLAGLLGGTMRRFIAGMVGDAAMVVGATDAVIRGDLAAVYDHDYTSAPGYPLLAAPFVAALRPALSSSAHFWVGVAATLAVAPAGVFAGRRLGMPARSRREAALVVWLVFLPPLAGGVLEFFHPQDALALAALLVSVGLAAEGRWTAAGRWFGLTLVLRHWALLALLPAIVAAPRGRRARLAATAAAVFVVGSLPVLLTDPDPFLRMLRAPWDVTVTFRSWIASYGPSEPALRRLIVRGAPLVGATAVALLVWWRRAPGMSGDRLWGLAVAALAFRPLFEGAIFLYYLAPLAALLVVWDAARSERLAAAPAWVVTFLLFYYAPLDLTYTADLRPQGFWETEVFALALVAVYGGAVAVGLRPWAGGPGRAPAGR